MIPLEELKRLLTQATIDIEAFMKNNLEYDNHSELANLFFARADIHFTMKNYQAAMDDYETCLDYDAYFHEAVTRMDVVMDLIMRMVSSDSKKIQ